MAKIEDGIYRSGRYAEILQKDYFVFGTDRAYPASSGQFKVNVPASGILSLWYLENGGDDNIVNVSGDYIGLDSGSAVGIVVGLEFPGSPSLCYMTLLPGDFVRQPFLSARVVAATTGADEVGLIRLIHGRGDFSIRRA